MDFPANTLNLRHRLGGRIASIRCIAHECEKPVREKSMDVWFFIGTVQWSDTGKTSEDVRIFPYAVSHAGDDEGRAQYDALMKALSEYLLEKGTWRDRDWFAHDRETAPAPRPTDDHADRP